MSSRCPTCWKPYPRSGKALHHCPEEALVHSCFCRCAEVKELREALKKIADDKCSASPSLIDRINAMEDCARAALNAIAKGEA